VLSDGTVINGYETRESRAPTVADVQTFILPLLRNLVESDKNQEVRDAAALALGRVGGLGELPLLRTLSEDRQGSVREAAILGLGLLELRESEERLVLIAKDPERLLRERGLAIMALGLSGGELAEELLLKDLGNNRSDVFQRRARNGHFDPLRALAAMLTQKHDIAKPSTGAKPHPHLGHIIQAIRADVSPDDYFLPVSLASLSKSRDPAAGPIILSGLKHRKSVTRAGAAIAAGRVFVRPDANTLKRFSQIIDDESDLLTRRLLLISLGRMGGEEVRDYLLRYLKSADRQETGFVYLALGLTRDPAVIPVLRATFEGAREASQKSAAALALGVIGDRESVDALINLLESDKNPTVRAYVAEALTIMGDIKAIPALERLLRDQKSEDVIAASTQGLGLLGSRTSIPLMLKALRESSSLPERGAIAYGLGRMGDRLVIEPLAALAKDQSAPDLVRAFAVVSLGIVGERSPGLPPFSRTTIDSHYGITIETLTELRDVL
jgi:HEAT repeat protein